MKSLLKLNDFFESEIMRPTFNFANVGFCRNPGFFGEFGLSPAFLLPQESHSIADFSLFLKDFIHWKKKRK